MREIMLGLLAGLFLSLCAFAQHAEKLGDSSWALISEDPRSSNSVVFGGEDFALLVDPGLTPAAASARIEQAEALTGKSVKKIILTSADPACALGVLLLIERDFEVLCHPETRRYLAEHAAEMLRAERERAETPEEAGVFDARRFRLPDRSFVGEENFELGDHLVVAPSVEPAQTLGGLVVRSTKDLVAAVGGFGVDGGAVTVLEEANLDAWMDVFRRLASSSSLYVASRGELFSREKLLAAGAGIEFLLKSGDWEPQSAVADEPGALGLVRLKEASEQPYVFDALMWAPAWNGANVLVSGLMSSLDVYQGKEQVSHFDIGSDPAGVAVTQDGRLAFVPFGAEGVVARFDLYNQARLPDVSVGDLPGVGALTMNDTEFVVPIASAGKLVFLNTASGETTAELAKGIGAKPKGIAATPNRRFGLVWYEASGQMTLVDLNERRVVARETIDEVIRSMRFHGDRLEIMSDGPSKALAFAIPETWRTAEPTPGPPAEVAVMGMIHTGHLSSELWGLEEVAETIRRFKPDAVLVEIPPDRWEKAWDDFTVRGVVEESRVKVFAEYRELMFDLSFELGFEIVPCAGWTEPMNDLRRTRSREFNEDEQWAEVRAELERVSAEVEARWQGSVVHGDDPRVIHSAEYDRYVREVMDPVGRLQNDMIGPGGWYNINRAHMRLVNQAIDARPGQRLLVTFGAFHKYMFLDELRDRKGVELVELGPYLEE